MVWLLKDCCFAILLLLTAFGVTARAGNVTYDGRSLVIDGQHKILFSGSIHYPRSTPEMWPSLIAKAKEGGIDAIQTYVFWDLHEPRQGQMPGTIMAMDRPNRPSIVIYGGTIKPGHFQGHTYDIVSAFQIGGTPAVFWYLLELGYLDGDCMTVTGKTLAENAETFLPLANGI